MGYICTLFLLLLSLFYVINAQDCPQLHDCDACLTQSNGSCNWCNSLNGCFNPQQELACSDQIRSADIFNIGTRFIEVIVPFYVALTIFAIIVHYLRVHLIEPIIDFHVDRRNATDFSAFVDPNIERIVNSNVPASEQIIWTDVSLKISRWRHLLIPVGCLVLGGLILSFLPKIPSSSPYFLPIFILLALPILHLIISGLHQLIKKRHYTHVYLLTTSGAIVIYYPPLPLPFLSSPRVYQFPYRCMTDIVQVHVMYKVASIYFAPSWDIAQNNTNNKQWKKSRVGFENIVKANEVEDLLQQQVTQGSPPAARRSASHYHL